MLLRHFHLVSAAPRSVQVHQPSTDDQGRSAPPAPLQERIDRRLAAGNQVSQLLLRQSSGDEIYDSLLDIHAPIITYEFEEVNSIAINLCITFVIMKTLATRLAWARTEKGWSQQELADKASVAQSTIGSLESGARQSGRKIAVIASVLGVDALWLAEGKGAPHPTRLVTDVDEAPEIVGNLKKIPVVGRVQAGPDGLLHVDDYPHQHGEGHMLWWSTCANAYALRIRGESMSPRYRPGEFVGVDPCAEVNPSDEVIVLLKNEQRMIKRLLWMRDDQACFESVNQNFKNIILDIDDIERMHLVLGNIPKAAFRSE